MLRPLRIAVSVVSGLCCVLVILLWVRSHWYQDRMIYPAYGQKVFEFDSAAGELWMQAYDLPTVIKWNRSVHSFKLQDPYLSFVTDLRQSTTVGFGRIGDPMGPITIVPHWFIALLAAWLTATPWLPWWSKRFSLRTLLIATTVVALALGLIVYFVRG